MNARFTVSTDVEPKEEWLDEYGFTAPGAISQKRDALELLSDDIVVVTGDPWIGKTHVSHALYAEARRRESDRASARGGAVFVDRLSLEDGARTPEPTWWRDWVGSRAEAWWIIDALDEAVHVNIAVSEVLRPALTLTSDQRRGLHIVIFSRDDDSLADLKKELGDRIPAKFERLLPFDQAEARRIVEGAGRSFEQVLRHLRDPSLRGLAKFEPVLRVLAGSADHRPRIEVLREVLETLCGEHSARRRMERAERWNKQDMFHAASRIAAVMLLCDIPTVELELGHGQLRLADTFASQPALRHAAELLRHTSVFRKDPTGFRFRQQYVKELLAAFGLRGLSPEALRLLTRGNARAIPPRLSTLETILRDMLPQVFDDPLPDLTKVAQTRTAQWASEKIDGLLAAVGDRPWRTPRREESLQLFNVSGIERVLDKRLANKAIPESGRELLFDIAFACELTGLSRRAAQIAMDTTEPPELRVLATYFATRFGGRGALNRLRRLLAPSAPPPPPRVLARVVEVLVNQGMLAPLEAAAITPAPEEHFYDAREAAVAAVERHLTPDEARTVVDDWTGGASLPATILTEVRERLRSRSVELLLATASASSDDVKRVARLMEMENPRHLDVLDQRLYARLAAEPAFREALYREVLGSELAPRISFALEASDARWLLRLAEANPTPSLLDDLYRLMRDLPPEDPLVPAVRSLFESRHPGELDARDARRSKADAEMRELEERRKRQRPETRVPAPLSEVVEQILGEDRELAKRHGDWTPSQVLRMLGWVCFVESAFRPHDVAGSFRDLPTKVQSRVIARVRSVLSAAEPEPIPQPTQTTYSGNLMYEAAAFRAALTFDPERSWVTPALVARWLPAVLFAGHDDVPAVVSELLKKVPEQTRICAFDAVQRELDREHAIIARQLPKETWSDDFAEQVGELVAGGGTERGRAPLLRVLAVRRPWIAMRIARRLLQEASDRTIRLTSADILLAIGPEELTWELLEPFIRSTGDVEAMLGLLGSLGGDPHVNAGNLPPELLVALAQRLSELYPREPVADRFGPRWVGRDDEARRTRDRLLAAVIDASTSSSEAARGVERLSASDQSFAHWAAAARTTGALDAALEALAPEPHVPTPEEVVRALDEESYRPIRTELDLWRLITEIIRSGIGPSVGHDIDLLYNVPSRRGATGSKPRRDEGKLQAYVRRRLEDLFPRYWGAVRLDLLYLREPQDKFRRRFDILVVASLPGSKTAAVPIEIKWSDDSRCEKALTEQLVKKYLVDAGRLHGVYLVGWCGSPKGPSWDRRKRAHARQVSRASASRRALRVAAAYLECPWQDPDAERAQRRRRRRRRS